MYSEIVETIKGLFPQQDFVPLHSPCFAGNEKKYLNECIDSTYVSSVGKFVDRFEEEMAAYTGAKRAVVCVNGTNAIHLALMLVGVEREDEVLTQPLTFIATCNALSYCGAHPVFIDVDRDTLGLSPAKLDEWISEHAELRGDTLYNKQTGRRIKACVPMHTFGHPVHLDELVEICHRYHLELVEDAAESIGSFYHGQHTGTFGKIGVLSFNGNKTITTGGGGMLLFRDEELAKLAKHISTQAKVPHQWEFVHDHIGYNYRMPNINAALGCAQLETLPLFLEKKRELATTYKAYFDSIGVEFMTEPEGCRSNYWLNTIIMKDKEERDAFLEYTNSHGVMARPIWQLMNKLPMFSQAECGDLSNCIYFEERIINIPSSVRL
ncbi:LegC family aminotransferase [uncultured Bacteroides sp.]|uniref:LegC family aminotransferase n=1 Tax=uncultured Bacteroides sp. TaxID=162156 RepID=UPI002AA6529F|nr:LegC family aminotransferase [uncultured Bacteroides sp.]